MNRQYWYFLIYLDNEYKHKREVYLQKCILDTKNRNQRPKIFLTIEQISFNFDIKRKIVSDIFYKSCEEDDKDDRPWIDFHNVRKIIKSTKNEQVGDLYDLGYTSIVEENFWKYMMRKRKNQKTMARKLKEKFKNKEEL